MAYYDGELLKQNLGKAINEFEELNVPLSEVAIKIGQAIKNTPTADVVEVKHGEWDVNVGMNFNKERICPICKKRIESNYWEFCSHCGAKMDGRSDT